jgi:hypothetical protein
MQWFFLAVILACLLVLAANGAVNVRPQVLARHLRVGGALAILALAVLLLFVGRAAIALPFAAFALMLLARGLGGPRGFGFPGGATKSAGQQSRVRSAHVEMVLDHDTGDIEGGFLKGSFAGRGLAELDLQELIGAHTELRRDDPQGAQLLQAYLDRRFPDWRDGAEAGGETDFGAAQPMSRDEALETLGLGPDATQADIRAAHRRLMKKLHPDQGGSTVLAARVNQAKDYLLATRR